MNTHVEGLFEIYKMSAIAHCSKLKMFENVDNLFDRQLTNSYQKFPDAVKFYKLAAKY